MPDQNEQMWWAACNGNKVKMEQLLDGGADIEFKESSHVCIPRAAAPDAPRAGRRLLFASLQLSGSRLPRHRQDNQTALHASANSNSIECVQALIGRGANINALDNVRTALNIRGCVRPLARPCTQLADGAATPAPCHRRKRTVRALRALC